MLPCVPAWRCIGVLRLREDVGTRTQNAKSKAQRWDSSDTCPLDSSIICLVLWVSSYRHIMHDYDV
jgi:hypothetical protein